MSEQTEHTPGPWQIGFSDGSGADLDEGVWIVAQEWADIPDPVGTRDPVVVRGGQDDWDTARGVTELANARLIAAAPDLLAALQEHLRLWSPDLDMPSFNDAIEQAQAAVAKATGEQP